MWRIVKPLFTARQESPLSSERKMPSRVPTRIWFPAEITLVVKLPIKSRRTTRQSSTPGSQIAMQFDVASNNRSLPSI
jgi:hypothetical protein